MITIKLADEPVITAHWHGGESHQAHICLNGKEVNVYTFGNQARLTNSKEFHRWAKNYGDEVVDTIIRGAY